MVFFLFHQHYIWVVVNDVFVTEFIVNIPAVISYAYVIHFKMV